MVFFKGESLGGAGGALSRLCRPLKDCDGPDVIDSQSLKESPASLSKAYSGTK